MPAPIDPHAVAGRIKAERERLGLTQRQVADALGAGAKQTYSQLERRANPSLSRLVELARIGFDVRAIAPELFGRSRA